MAIIPAIKIYPYCINFKSEKSIDVPLDTFERNKDIVTTSIIPSILNTKLL